MDDQDNNAGKLELGLYPAGYNARAVAYIHAYVRGLKPSPMTTLLAIAQHLNDGSATARLGKPKIAELTGLSKSAVKTSLDALYKTGHLVKHAKTGPYGENIYSLPDLTYLPPPIPDAEEIHAQEMKAGAEILSRPKGERFGGADSDPILSPSNTKKSDSNNNNDNTLVSERDSMGSEIDPSRQTTPRFPPTDKPDLADFRNYLEANIPWVIWLSELFADTLIATGRKPARFRTDAYSGEWLDAFFEIEFELRLSLRLPPPLDRANEFFVAHWKDRPERDVDLTEWNRVTGDAFLDYLRPVFEYVANPPDDAPEWVQYSNRPRALRHQMTQLLDIVRPPKPPEESAQRVERQNPRKRIKELVASAASPEHRRDG